MFTVETLLYVVFGVAMVLILLATFAPNILFFWKKGETIIDPDGTDEVTVEKTT